MIDGCDDVMQWPGIMEIAAIIRPISDLRVCAELLVTEKHIGCEYLAHLCSQAELGHTHFRFSRFMFLKSSTVVRLTSKRGEKRILTRKPDGSLLLDEGHASLKAYLEVLPVMLKLARQVESKRPELYR